MDLYRVLISSFLVVFVPQLCPAGGDDPTGPHDCTINEQVTDLSYVNLVALGLNGATAIWMLLTFVVEFVRERWLIRKFEANENFSLDTLRIQLTQAPELRDKLGRRNRVYFIMMLVATLMQIANMILSGIIVFAYFYNGVKTITTCVGCMDAGVRSSFSALASVCIALVAMHLSYKLSPQPAQVCTQPSPPQ